MKIKVRIKNMVESSKVQGFLLSNGFERPYNSFVLIDGWLCVDGNSILCVGMSQASGELDEYEQISFDQLRDMVVLKRNSIDDATHKNSSNQMGYLASDGVEYFWNYHINKWNILQISTFESRSLKPIQNNDLSFDSEESLNDKVASAEVARQKQPNKKTIDVMDGVKLMESLAQFNNTDRGADFDNFELFEKHSHYKKDVSHLEFIDVYRVLDLFEVESHAVGHAIKKLLCSGQRGAKDKAQDTQEAIDSLNRELEMMRENGNS